MVSVIATVVVLNRFDDGIHLPPPVRSISPVYDVPDHGFTYNGTGILQRLFKTRLRKIRTGSDRPVAVVCAAAHIDAMEAVFILHHVRADDEYGDDAKLIGAYRTESDAKAATERLSGQPGFVDHPEGWQIDRHVLNHDQWSEGFVSGMSNGS